MEKNSSEQIDDHTRRPSIPSSSRYHRPPKPPKHNLHLNSETPKRNSDNSERNKSVTYNEERDIHIIDVVDYADYGDFETGGGKKQTLYKKVRNLQHQNVDGPPYKTLQPEEETKNALYTGGKAKHITIVYDKYYVSYTSTI